MSTKALKSQLLAAVAMVLVASIALGSSTYAWFAANTSVTASTTSISAKSDVPFLLISDAEDGDYATSASISATASNLLLVTPLNVASNVQYYADAAAKTAGTKTTPTKFTAPANVLWGTTYSSDVDQVEASNVTTQVTSENLDKYVLTTHVYIKTADNTTAKNLKVDKPTVTAGTNTIADAYRIMFVCGGKYAIYDKGTDTLTGDVTLVSTVDSTTVNDITIYVYFDGTDEVSKTAEAGDLTAITSTLKFSVDETV